MSQSFSSLAKRQITVFVMVLDFAIGEVAILKHIRPVYIYVRVCICVFMCTHTVLLSAYDGL